ncbi:MAG: neutral/alkaline non-lysosomal ceramidase N-terminal domain-containing protein [Acidobacteriaceae bacterium]|nr:neutral/alkaline non-lysosomal ceramidase N-terminal domain-containing protein [Acidobacteriaceae bacterium]
MLLRSLLTIFLATGPLAAGPFRAGAAKIDITPEDSQWLMGYAARQSTGVHDRIYHRVIAVDDGMTQFYLVSSDLCLFSPSVYHEAAERLHHEFGIEPRNFWWSVTHSHATPEVGPPEVYKTLLGRSEHEWNRSYASFVVNALIDGVRKAREKLEPARLGIGVGLSMANINRRAKDVDGRVSLGLNPEGPVDRQIGLLRLERLDGSPIAVVANYAMHGTVMSGANLQISGDAPGAVSAYVEQKVGAPVLYVNGAAGNLAPIYSVYPDARSGHLSQFNVLLGDRILAALAALGPASSDVRLSTSERIFETARKPGLEWPEGLAAYTRGASGGTALVRLPVRLLRINDTVIWSAPVEMFCEIATAVRDRSLFPHTFYFGYTNGWLGYLPTKVAFEEGGYESNTSVFTGAAERDVLEGVITYLQAQPR